MLQLYKHNDTLPVLFFEYKGLVTISSLLSWNKPTIRTLKCFSWEKQKGHMDVKAEKAEPLIAWITMLAFTVLCVSLTSTLFQLHPRGCQELNYIFNPGGFQGKHLCHKSYLPLTKPPGQCMSFVCHTQNNCWKTKPIDQNWAETMLI